MLSYQAEPASARGDRGLLEKPVRGEAFQGDFHAVAGEAFPQHVEIFDEVIHRGVVAVVQGMNAFREVHAPVEKQGGFRRRRFDHEEVRPGMIGAEEEGPQLELDPRVDPERLLRDGDHTPFREGAALSVDGRDADHGPIVVDRDDGIEHDDEIRSRRRGKIEVADPFRRTVHEIPLLDEDRFEKHRDGRRSLDRLRDRDILPSPFPEDPPFAGIHLRCHDGQSFADFPEIVGSSLPESVRATYRSRFALEKNPAGRNCWRTARILRNVTDCPLFLIWRSTEPRLRMDRPRNRNRLPRGNS